MDQHHRARRWSHPQFAVAVPRSFPGGLGARAPLKAVPPQELGDLGLEGDLQEEAGADAGDLFQDPTEVAFPVEPSEEVVHLGTEVFAGQ